jgi:hypothetical protein
MTPMIMGDTVAAAPTKWNSHWVLTSSYNNYYVSTASLETAQACCVQHFGGTYQLSCWSFLPACNSREREREREKILQQQQGLTTAVAANRRRAAASVLLLSRREYNNATAAVVGVAAASSCYDLICIHMVEIQSKKYDTIQQSLGPASNLHAPGSRCPPPSLPPARGLWHHWSTDHVRVATIDTYLHVACLCFCPDSMMVCSHGALSGVWMPLLLRRCSRDAQILAAGAASRRPSRRTGLTDGRTACATGRFLLLQCCRRLMERGKRELPPPSPFFGGSQETEFFLWRIFASWWNNHNTK